MFFLPIFYMRVIHLYSMTISFKQHHVIFKLYIICQNLTEQLRSFTPIRIIQTLNNWSLDATQNKQNCKVGKTINLLNHSYTCPIFTKFFRVKSNPYLTYLKYENIGHVGYLLCCINSSAQNIPSRILLGQRYSPISSALWDCQNAANTTFGWS